MKLINKEITGCRPHGRLVAPGVWVGINCSIDFEAVEIVPPVYIGSSVQIEKGARIVGPAMIGSGSVIKENVTIDKTIVLGYTKVNAFATIEAKIIAGKYIINPLGTSVDIEESDMNFLVDDARKDEAALSEEHQDVMAMIKNIHEMQISK